MHQPWYVDLATGQAILPWVRLHALKEYLDIPALAAGFPDLVQTFNWVPALLDQVERAAAGGGDAHLAVAEIPAEELDESSRRFLVREFFSIGEKEVRALAPYRRIRDHVRALGSVEAAADSLPVEDLRDLQVWFHLAWSGDLVRARPDVAPMIRRKRHFSEEEKRHLLAAQRSFLGEILPAIRQLISSGAVAASTSPYHHPILPLLFEPATAFADDPTLRPPERIAPRPDDGLEQVRLGRETFARHFGFLPNGMWPPEGAVGPETLRRLGGEGVAWVATDEAILHGSLPASRRWAEGDFASRTREITRPWRLGGSGPAVFFRDRDLSDRIGFVYSHWDAEEAAADFVGRIRLRAAATGETPGVLTIALDGENAWENYERSGRPFLRALFTRLSATRDLKVVGFEEALAEVPCEELPNIRTGSWIDANLHTWAGDEEKNRAWTMLTRVAATTDPVARSHRPKPLPEVVEAGDAAPDPSIARAAMMAAEASDWFWWFGEGHSSAHDADFDRLFRAHLASACRHAGVEAPKELERPVRRDRGRGDPRREPTGPVRATLDGRASHYYEWLAAGRLSGGGEGTMHHGSGRVRELFFGTDGRNLFLRLDPKFPPASERLADTSLVVSLQQPVEREFLLPLQKSDEDPGAAVAVVGRIVEARIPLSDRPLDPDSRIAFRIELRDERGRSVQRIPEDGWVEFPVAAVEWSV